MCTLFHCTSACNDETVQAGSARARALNETRNRILDVALEVLGENPDAGMADVASAAGVVRRTVYGHFPARADLVRTLARRAVDEIAAMLAEIDRGDAPAEKVWVDFVARLWPLARRYRVVVALRRGEYGAEIHALLDPVDRALAELVGRGQASGAFARHLPAAILSQIAYAAVFAIAENELSNGAPGVRAATIASLLTLGVPEERAQSLADGRQ